MVRGKTSVNYVQGKISQGREFKKVKNKIRGLDFPEILPAKVCGESDVFVLECVLLLEFVLLMF